MKKFTQLNESKSEDMVEVKKGRYGNYVDATISINIKGYLEDNDNRTEISLEEAIGIIMNNLDRLSGSNDGSELLANVQEDQIKFN